MELRPLGPTGRQVSAVSLGLMNFGAGTDEVEAARIPYTALDAGVKPG
jgi:aryl-alcohol dehydrogenase-like predicted oxidoreductase